MRNKIQCLFVVLSFLMLLYPLDTKAKCKKVYTSSIRNWTPASLDSLINTCEEGTTIVFDADYDYTIDRCLKPKVSISIKGCGKRLRTINPYNYVISLFDVKDIDFFAVENLIIDGSYSTSNPNGYMPKEFFITVKNVKTVSFSHCSFQNIRTDYPKWKAGDEAYTIWVENYDKFIFCDNVVQNCDCPEFMKVVLPKDNTNPNKIADICRNKMQFVRTSSAIEVRFGRFRINNNEIGLTRGSTINAYGFDSEIVGNRFQGSHRSSSIDLSEQYYWEYESRNILVKDNYSEYARDGFLMADHVSGIKIINNTYRADLFEETEHNRYDKTWSIKEKPCELALRLDHDVSNITIKSNLFVGAQELVYFNAVGHKENISIENNVIKNVENPKRSTMVITQIDGLKVKNNTFINTGKSLSYLDAPQFIVIGPTRTDNASERYARRIDISNNSFLFTNKNISSAYILAHTIYDQDYCNTLSSLSNISIKRNNSGFDGNILLVSDEFETEGKVNISIKRNKFKSGRFSGNVTSTEYAGKVGREELLRPNTIVEKDGNRYYVILGGKTSSLEQDYETSLYIRDGRAILRKIN